MKRLSSCVLGLEKGGWVCQCVWVDMLSCVAVGSALHLFHIASWCLQYKCGVL